QQKGRRVVAGGQDARQVFGGGAFVAQQPQVPVCVAEGLGGFAERQKAAVGIGRVGEPAQHHREQGPLDRRAPADSGGERGQVAQCPGGVGVAERFESRLRGLRGQLRGAEGGLA